MKSLHRFAFVLLGALLSASSQAEMVAAEYFNDYGTTAAYTGGLSGGTGDWTSNWSASDVSYAPGSSLSYSATGYDNSPNLSGNSDGAATGTTNLTTSPSTAFRTFNDGDASTIWISSLISVSGSDRAVLWIDATSATPSHFIGVLDGQIVMRYNNGSANTIGTVGAWGDNTNPNGNATFTSGTALLLAKIEVNNSGNDTFSFWFNPDLSGGEGGLGGATLSAPAGFDLFGDEIGGIGMLVAGTAGGNEYLDAILVGTTFEDVVPQPSQSGVIATEYFNGYGTSEIVSDGTNLTGGTGWSSAWLNADEKYLPASSISYTATGYDNSANLSGPGDGAMAYAGDLPMPSVSTATRSITTPATTVWFSALISIDETWDRAVLWIDSVGGSAGNDFVGVLDGAIQMRYNGGNVTTAGAPTVGTHLLLAKAEIDVDGANDRLSFWFDPDLSSGEAGLGTPTYTDDTADTFGTAIDGIGVLLVNRDEDGLGGYITDTDTEVENGELIDAIRVGTTLAAVIANPQAMPQITSITKTGATVTVEFTGSEGASYGLNKSLNLDFTTPNIVATTAVSGGTGTLEDTSANTDAAFYRVESQD